MEIRETMVKELRVVPKAEGFGAQRAFAQMRAQAKAIDAYLVDDDTNTVQVPFSWALNNIPDSDRPPRSEYQGISIKWEGTLRGGQAEIKDQVVDTLNRVGTMKLALYPGFGKTSMSVYLTSRIKLKTLVIAHRVVLIKQWADSFARFCPKARVQILEKKKPIDDRADVVIINAENVEKYGHAFSQFGFVIVDEIHCIATASLIKSLFYLTPRYLLGLSATPTRPDGMDALLDLYFGNEIIHRALHRPHTYYCVKTGLKPETKLQASGKLDWGSLLDWQANSEERNNMILEIVKRYPSRFFLILCKRVSQAAYLKEKLEEQGETVCALISSNNTLDTDARVVIATIQKAGVGFSHDILDSLIIAGDVEEYFIQYLGRVMRREDVEPLVWDLVDDQSTCVKHFRTRKKVSQESGGKIENWNF